MAFELAIQNGACSGGLGGQGQISTIEQSQAMEGTRGVPLLAAELISFRSVQGYAAGRLLSAKSIGEHLGAGQAVVDGFRALDDKGKSVSRQSREKNWLAAHRHEFKGRWIALDGDQLLASGASAREVFAAVGKHKPTPLVMEIPEQESSFPGW